MRDRTQRAEGLPFPGLGRPPEPAGTFPIGSVELIGSGMMTQLLLMMPGIRMGTGVRPFRGGHGRIVWMGAGAAWAYVWPDGSVTGEEGQALSRGLADAYQGLLEAGLPALGAFSLEVGPERGSYEVECAPTGRRWSHPVDA